MSIERINFTSSLLDKARINTQLKPVVTEEKTGIQEEVKNEETEKATSEAPTNEESSEEIVTEYVTSDKSHKARNWTIGLSAAAVLTGLGVLAGRGGYLGGRVERMLKGAKKETGELIDDISESVNSTMRKSSSETSSVHSEQPLSEGTVTAKVPGEEPIIQIGTIDNEAGSIIGRTSEESSVLGRVSEDEGSVLGRTSDELAEQEPLVSTSVVDDAEGRTSSVLLNFDEEPLIIEDEIKEIFSKDGKFKIPMSKDEIDMKATRKYLKAKKVKVPRKYKKLPELKIEKVLGDFKPENVDKTKINGGVYIHQLPKGERLEVHYDWTNNNITYIDRFNAKDVNTGYVGYKRDEAGKFEFVELPNGYKYRFNDDGALAYGERCNGTDSYIYDRFGLLKRIDQKISDNVERKVFMRLNGKIDYVNYYVNTTEGQKLVKEDIYFHDENKIEEWFDANGDEDISIYGKSSSISTLAKLKFWKSDGFKKFLRDIVEEEDI